MLETLIELDKELLLFLNGLHSPFWDKIMFAISGKFFWLPLYIAIIAFLIKDKRKHAWLSIGCILLLFAFTEVVASQIFKPLVGRFRPTHDPMIGDLVHIVNGKKGGKFGYFSAHAANTFGLASVLFFLYKEKIKWVFVLLVWAAIVSYSRIYLGVHYPLDILTGALLGLGGGKIMSKIYTTLEIKFCT